MLHQMPLKALRNTSGWESCSTLYMLSLIHISVVGHADLVETTRGEWWMVLLGVRPYEGFHYNLGRETFLVPVTWDTEDEWLKIDNANGQVNSRERKPELEETVYPVRESFTGFEGGRLGPVSYTHLLRRIPSAGRSRE